MRGVLVQATHDNGDNLRGYLNVRPYARQRRRCLIQLRHQSLHGTSTVERNTADQQLIGHNTKGINVRRRRHWIAEDLLGCHVFGRSHEQPLQGQVVAVVRKLFDQAKVEHFHLKLVAMGLVNCNVGRLDVAVNRTEMMGFAQRSRRLADDMNHQSLVHGAFLSQAPIKGSTLNQLHGDEENVAVAAVVEHGNGVRMAELCGGCSFKKEPFLKAWVVVALVARVQNLQRADAAQRRLLGAVNATHASASNQIKNAKAAMDNPTHQRIIFEDGTAGIGRGHRTATGRTRGSSLHGVDRIFRRRQGVGRLIFELDLFPRCQHGAARSSWISQPKIRE